MSLLDVTFESSLPSLAGSQLTERCGDTEAAEAPPKQKVCGSNVSVALLGSTKWDAGWIWPSLFQMS